MKIGTVFGKQFNKGSSKFVNDCVFLCVVESLGRGRNGFVLCIKTLACAITSRPNLATKMPGIERLVFHKSRSKRFSLQILHA